jgi:hypothetical protein
MTAKRSSTILDVMHDPKLFGPWFKGATWQAWDIVLAAIFALPVSKGHLPLFHKMTGRLHPLCNAAREAWLVCGRRAGKSRIAALVAVFLACFRDYRKYLAPGERGTVMVIAADRRQARVVFRYVSALLDGVPMLARLIEARTQDSISLTNGVSIEVHTASFRTTRGYTIVAAICDEIAFWPTDDAAEPDVEILNGLRPGMATVPSALLLCLSSPYARRGALWTAYEKHFGKDDSPVLVVQADTQTMNPVVPEEIIAQAYAEDPTSAAAEYGAEFRRDVESYVSREAIETCVIGGRLELPRVAGVEYVAFTDPAGGSGGDSFTLAISHEADGRAILDAVREIRPPFSPEAAVTEFAALLKAYGLASVTGDRYAGSWPAERFQTEGITYQSAEHTKSELYRELLPLLNSGRAELLDLPRLLAQLASLERRVARGGKDSIDHGPRSHDDVINAAAGALVSVSAYVPVMLWGGNIQPIAQTPAEIEAEETARKQASEQQIRDTIAREGAWGFHS